MAGLTSDTLVARVRRTAALPSADDYTDAEILAVADEHIKTLFVPVIQRQVEEYYLTSETISFVADQQDYRIPERAIGGSIRQVFLQYNGGQANSTIGELAKYSLELFYEEGTNSIGGDPWYYTLIGDRIRVRPTPTATNASTSLLVFYNRRPSNLVAVSSAMSVSATGSAPAYSVTSAFSNGSYTVDVVQANPNFDSLGDDLSVTVSGGTTATFSESITDLAVGDYICLAGETVIPQIPAELHPALVYSVASHLLMERGDLQGGMVWKQQAELLVTNTETLLTPRVRGATDKLQPRHGLFRQRGNRRGRNSRWRY